ncbi:sensor histidine kinase [Kribbella deserti]|uniref:Sensor histidine kinase n=1 Tax=Kribbella deserti TaxID=1926257 RepID=A0ABV6QP74_9ACTN
MRSAVAFPGHPGGFLEREGPLVQRPAERQFRRRSARLSALLRAASAVGATLVAVIGFAPPAKAAWVLVAVAGLLIWSGVFTVAMFRPGPRSWLAAGDIAVVMLICLAHGNLVPAAVLAASAGSGWVDVVASTGVFIAQFVLRQPVAMAAAIAIAVAYTVGAPGVREAPVILVLQGLLAAALVELLRRGAQRADLALAEEASVRASTQARSAARRDELDQQRLLHDTVLGTLTIVGTGSITRDSTALPERAARDLAVLADLRLHPTVARDLEPGPAPLDVALRTVVLTARVGLQPLDTEFEVPPLDLPQEVVLALSQGVAEALTNVARHADIRTARVTARSAGDGVVVEVCDGGRGFDPGAVASYRRGLRESVYGRMRAVGGSAVADSSPGAGTRIVLRWQP